jgi:hypothetical protein
MLQRFLDHACTQTAASESFDAMLRNQRMAMQRFQNRIDPQILNRAFSGTR